MPLGDPEVKILGVTFPKEKLDQWYQILGEEGFSTYFMVYPIHR